MGARVPVVIAAEGERAALRYVKFFTFTIRSPNTRAAYARACLQFLAWCDGHDLAFPAIQPVHAAAWIEGLRRTLAGPTVKQQLAAVRMLLDWLVVGQIVPGNLAAHVRGPSHIVSTGKGAVGGHSYRYAGRVAGSSDDRHPVLYLLPRLHRPGHARRRPLSGRQTVVAPAQGERRQGTRYAR
ncbi:site-specific integrase [Skermanella rosea]|nr:site-specific integrase [Skermanella rosea]